MTTMRVSSAPGKLVLFGEYAVLAGAPAIVAAVQRRARVELVRPAAFWSVDGRSPSGVVAAVLEEARSEPPATLRIDTTSFVAPGGRKLGLGSSAAVAVALFGALRGAADREAAFTAVDGAHRRAQGGHGSGVDVAASLWGGVLRYYKGRPPTRTRLPRGIRLLAVDTGIAARTADIVEAVARAAPASEMAHVCELAERAAAASDDAAAWLDLAEQYHAALLALGRAAGVPIVSDEHAAIEALVRRAGGVYKPSGAGGGDVGIAFADSAAALAAVEQSVTAAGYGVLEVAIDPQGLVVS